MGEVKRRKRETTAAHRARAAEVGKAESATEKGKKDAAHAPWIKAWEKETGKKHGIATRAAYLKWLQAKRAAREAKKKKGVTAKKQGAALAPEKK